MADGSNGSNDAALTFNPNTFYGQIDFLIPDRSLPWDSGWIKLQDDGPQPPTIKIFSFPGTGPIFQSTGTGGAGVACPSGVNVSYYIQQTKEFPLVCARGTYDGPPVPNPQTVPNYGPLPTPGGPTGPGDPGGPGGGQQPVSPFAAEPVNVTTGAFFEEQVDLHLNGPLPIEIKRTYSSLNATANNEYGYGWLPGYPSYLIPSDASSDPATIEAADSDGAIIVFRQQSGSTTVWAPTLADNPALTNTGGATNPFNDTIVQSTAGGTVTYTWNLPDGSVRNYVVQSFPITIKGVTYQRQRPYISSWVDNRGNQLTFTLGTNSTTTTYGLISLIQSSNGSSVSFTYNTDGHLTQAETNDGRTVNYTYDLFGNGDLTAVQLPDGSTFSYQYAGYDNNLIASRHLISQITKPDGRILQNTYDGGGRVVQQQATVGGEFVGSGLPITATFDYSVPDQTTVTDANDNRTVYEYNDSGLITKTTDPLNQAVTQTWYTATTGDSGAYPNSLQSVTDKRGLVTSYKYDAQGNITETDVTGNLTGAGSETATTTAIYNNLNLPTSVTDASGITTSYTYDPTYKYLPATISTSKGGAIRTDYLTYTSTGGAKGLLFTKTIADGSPDAATTEYFYDSAGFLTQQIAQTGTTDPDVVTNFHYNTHGELVTATDGDGRTTTYAYDGRDGDGMSRPISKVVTDENGNTVGTWTMTYTGNGDLNTTTGPRTSPANFVQRSYDGVGNLSEEAVALSQAKPDGSGVIPVDYAYTDYGYDFVNNLVMEVDPIGNITTMTYDGDNQMLSKTLSGAEGPVLRTESYTYEPGGKVATYTNPLGGVTKSYYTDNGLLRRQENPDGSVLSWTYYTDGRLDQEILRNGSTWTTVYDDVNRIVTRTLTNSTGTTLATESSAYDRRGNLISQTDADGYTKTATYDGLDRIKTSTGPATTAGSAQQTTTYIYGKSRKTFTVQNALGEQTVTTSDAIDRPVLVQVLDSSGHAIRTTSYAYSPDHNSVTVTEGTGAGAISRTTWTDTLDRPVLTVLGDGTFTSNTYDLNGNLVATTDALKQTTSYGYNALNQLVSQTLPDGTVTNFTSDAAGNPLTRSMANGTLTQAQTYDNAGRKLTEKLYSGSTSTRNYSYAYYPVGTPDAGLLETVTAPRDTITTTYDDFLRPSTVSTLSLSNGPATLNSSTTYTYDLRNLVTGISQTSGLSPLTSSLTRTYDGYGQLLTETVTAGATTYANVTQTWDAAGRRATLNDASSTLSSSNGLPPLFTYAHRADGLLAQATLSPSNGSPLNFNFNYADNGLLTSRVNPFRVMTVDTRDAVGRILQQSQGVNSTAPLVENLTWRNNSTINSYTATRTGTGAWNESRAYTYDPRGQLTSEGFTPAPNASNALNYAFDGTNPGLGVRLDAKIGTGAPASWETNATPNTLGQVTADSQVAASGQVVPASGTATGAAQVNILVDGIAQGLAGLSGGTWSINLDLAAGAHTLTANAVDPSGLSTATASSTFTVAGGNGNQPAGTVTSAYDADGNVTSRSWTSGVTQTLTWDAFDRLIGVSQRDNSDNGYDWTAVYDGLGRRISTTQQPVANNVDTGAPTVTASEYDPQVEFLEIGVAINGVKAWKVYGPDLNGIYGGLQGTGGLEATILDANGTATGVLNDYFGNGVATISGGAVTWNTTKVGGYGPLPDSTATPLTDATQLAQAIVWRSHRIDPTGFYYLGTRYYEPVSGRFLSCDSLGFAAGTDLYTFCNGDCVNSFDPDGRCNLDLPTTISYSDPNTGPGAGTNLSNNTPGTIDLGPNWWGQNNYSQSGASGPGAVPGPYGQNPANPSNGSNWNRMGTFDLTGTNGNTVIFYSKSGEDSGQGGESGVYVNAGTRDNGQNLAVDVDQAAAAGMSVNDYAASQMGNKTFNNAYYAYHQGPGTPDNPNGDINPSMRQDFSGDSGLAQIVSQHLTGGGYVVLDGCYGTDFNGGQPNNPAFVQGIANAYGNKATVIVGGTGQMNVAGTGPTPTTAPSQPTNDSNPGYYGNSNDYPTPTAWKVISPSK
jgi:RHS repeat-associated protein